MSSGEKLKCISLRNHCRYLPEPALRELYDCISCFKATAEKIFGMGSI